ncbi:hypothetical protein ACLBQS_27535, partial [Klebsiella pneumoniae]
MRLLNWRRQAALNAMPGIRPGEIHTPWHEFWRRFRRQPVAMGAGYLRAGGPSVPARDGQ